MNHESSDEFAQLLQQRAIDLSQQGVVALGSLYDLVIPRLMRYSQFLTQSQTEAEDVIQACFLRLARYPNRLAKAKTPWPYLLKIVRSEASKLLARRKHPGLDCVPADLKNPLPFAWDSWERDESIRDALNQLPIVQAEVVTLKIWEGLTFREIAEITEEPINTITSRYRYALDKLSVLLRAHADCEERLVASKMAR